MKTMSGKAFLYLGFFAFLVPAFAQAQSSIWARHLRLMSVEQSTDDQVQPVFEQLRGRGQHTETTQETARQAMAAIDQARAEFVEAFNQLSEAEKNAFIQALSQRSDAEILVYDFDPIAPLLSGRLEQIRRFQEERMNTILGRALDPVNPSPVLTGRITINTSSTPEINGANFPANHFAFTFDDGPNPRTTRIILDAFSERNFRAPAHFFVLGNRMEAVRSSDPGLVEEMYRSGHGIENHTWDHPQMPNVGLAAARSQIERTNAIIEQALGAFSYRSALFRFPYGARNQDLKNLVHSMGMTSVMWNIDTLDWKYRDPETVVELATSQIRQQGRGIILMHDIHAQTAIAVPHILQALRQRDAVVVKIETTGR